MSPGGVAKGSHGRSTAEGQSGVSGRPAGGLQPPAPGGPVLGAQTTWESGLREHNGEAGTCQP